MLTSLSPAMSLPVERSPAVASHAAGNLPGDVARDVAAAQAGDAEAFARLVNAHQALVLRLARGLAGRPEDAADLAQETFTRLYTSLPRFRFECAFSTWVYRIATNVGLDYVRRQRARRWLWHTAVEEGWEPPDTRAAMNPERHTLSGEIARRVQRALAALPARQRMVFELRHYQGLRLGLIAELLDTSEEVAKNALFRATRKLRADLVDLLEGGKR